MAAWVPILDSDWLHQGVGYGKDTVETSGKYWGCRGTRVQAFGYKLVCSRSLGEHGPQAMVHAVGYELQVYVSPHKFSTGGAWICATLSTQVSSPSTSATVMQLFRDIFMGGSKQRFFQGRFRFCLRFLTSWFPFLKSCGCLGCYSLTLKPHTSTQARKANRTK